VTESKRVMTR